MEIYILKNVKIAPELFINSKNTNFEYLSKNLARNNIICKYVSFNINSLKKQLSCRSILFKRGRIK